MRVKLKVFVVITLLLAFIQPLNYIHPATKIEREKYSELYSYIMNEIEKQSKSSAVMSNFEILKSDFNESNNLFEFIKLFSSDIYDDTYYKISKTDLYQVFYFNKNKEIIQKNMKSMTEGYILLLSFDLAGMTMTECNTVNSSQISEEDLTIFKTASTIRKEELIVQVNNFQEIIKDLEGFEDYNNIASAVIQVLELSISNTEDTENILKKEECRNKYSAATEQMLSNSIKNYEDIQKNRLNYWWNVLLQVVVIACLYYITMLKIKNKIILSY